MNGFNGFSLKEKLSNIWYGYRKYIIIISIVVLVMLITLIIVLNSSKNNKQKHAYELVESIMVYNAKEYIKNNEITKDMYISLNYLNIEIDSNLKCNSNSGVLVEDNSYTPYLMCEGYNSQVVANVIKENEENSKYGVLLGDNPYIVTDTYQELGISLVEGYTVNIKDSNIDNGINKVTYNILESGSYVTHIDRIVIAEGILGSSPIIELVGNQTRTVEINTQYIESGYTATDKIDGNITDKVKVEGSVDTSKAGTYTLTYSVTNTRGKSVSVKRKVIVNDNSINLDITHTISPTAVTSTGVKITLDIKGEGYSYTITDNGERVTSKNPTYTAYKNGTYEFTIYDKNDNSEVYSVEITNIDITPPTLTCTGTIKDNTTIINVDSSDTKYYVVNYDNKTSEKISTMSYTFNDIFVNATIKGYDEVGNEATTNCEIKQEYIKGILEVCPIPNGYSIDDVMNRQVRLFDVVQDNGEVSSDSMFPGGGRIIGKIKVANKTISFKQYVMGVIPCEVESLIKSSKYEGLKLFMILVEDFFFKNFPGGKAYMQGNELMVRISSSFQCYAQYKYDQLNQDKKYLLDQSFEDVKKLILIDKDTNSPSKVYYNDELQKWLAANSNTSTTLLELFNSNFFREYIPSHISSAGKIFANSEIYLCK